MPLHPLELDLDHFLALGWSAGVQAKLREIVWEPHVNFLLARRVDGKLAGTAFSALPDPLPDGLVALWRKDYLQNAMKSKTQQAVDLVLKNEMTPHAAAALMKVHPSAVYRALTRAQEKQICPCCKQVVRDSFEIDRSVLKNPSGGQDAA